LGSRYRRHQPVDWAFIAAVVVSPQRAEVSVGDGAGASARTAIGLPGDMSRFHEPWEEEMELLLWGFILIGNAAALVILSEVTKGGTSAMG
jgi:hypothetical protein